VNIPMAGSPEMNFALVNHALLSPARRLCASPNRGWLDPETHLCPRNPDHKNDSIRMIL
jgi:hypothetical protein